MPAIIYRITNTLNYKTYIGQTSRTLDVRWREHCYEANSGADTSLHRAIRKYGQDSFLIDELERTDLDLLDEREIYWIQHLNPEYNQTTGGNSLLALWRDPEGRERIVAGIRAHAQSPKGRERRRETTARRYTNVVYYEHHRETMTAVNRDPFKRENNKQTILRRWKDPEFAAKMQERIAAGKQHRKSSSDAMKKLWSDPVRREAMLAARRVKKEQKA